MKPYSLIISCLFLVAALVPNAHAQAEDPLFITLGARLLATGWEGENEGLADSDFESDDGGAFGVRFLMQKGRLYGGISLQGGEYDFDDETPDLVFEEGLLARRDDSIKREEADFLLGYYFWDQVSLFLDIKSVTNEWDDVDYALHYAGLGFGVSGFIPLNESWTVYGTFGLVPLEIRADGDNIGDGLGSAIEFGAVWRFAKATNLVIGLRNQHQEYDFDNDAEQTHDIGGLVIGINHRFEVQ